MKLADPVRRSKFSAALLAFLAAIPLALAQNATPGASATTAVEPFAFDVVSIKPNSTGKRGSLGFFNDTYRADGHTLETIVLFAYFPPTMRGLIQHIDGFPSWAGSEQFDIVAKVDADAAARIQSATLPVRGTIVQSMVQQLLAERCGLILHHAPMEVQGYALTVTPNGSKLTQSEPSDVVPQDFKDMPEGAKAHMISKRGYWPEVDYFHVSTAALAEQLSTMRNMLIVDQTGLKGTYNFKLLPLDGGPIAGDGSSPDNHFENAVPWDLKRLGLQLMPIKVKTETIVIDSIHRPTPN